MTTFLARFEPPDGDGPTLAVKDVIDLAGQVTTAGSPALVEARPAEHDAAAIVRARAAGVRIVGKTNLHELAYGGTGINDALGTPVNPLDASRIPGGSSSGSAVAVATGDADIALGTDTAGSIRTPSACCGTVGLKTTRGLVPLEGVRALAPSLDTLGPMGRTVDAVARGLALLVPDLPPGRDPEAPPVARLRLPDVDDEVDAAVDDALDRAGITPTTEGDAALIDRWLTATDVGVAVLLAEAAVVNGPLADARGDQLGDDVLERVELGRSIGPAQYREALRLGRVWERELAHVLDRVGVLAMPTLPVLAPPLASPHPRNGVHSVPVNLAGVPALALPVPTGGSLPASVQLVGRAGSEAELLALGRRIEGAVA